MPNYMKLELELLKSDEITWEQEQKVSETMEKMDEIFSQIEKVQETMEKIQEQAEQNNLVSEDLVEKFSQFQELLDKVMTPDMLEALEKLQEAMEEMDPKKMLDALENFDGSLIVVSHDRDFLSGLTEFVYEVTPTGLRQYIGDIKIFLHAKHAESIGAYEASKTGERVIGKGKNTKLEKNSKKSDSNIKIDFKMKKELEKAIKKVDKKINRLEKSVSEAEKELEIKNTVISEVDSTDMKLMTNLSYEFEKIQKRHDRLLTDWENALIEKEELEDQL